MYFLVGSCHFRFNIQDCYVDKSNGVVVIMEAPRGYGLMMLFLQTLEVMEEMSVGEMV